MQSKSTIKIKQDALEITPLGAGNEVGRSAILVNFKGKSVLFDCGVHPAHSGLASLPFFDQIDPKTVDLVLISHFHLDHCGAVPYFLEKTNFKGRIFMTHPTKAIYKLLLSDFVKVSNVGVNEMLFNEQDLVKSLDKIETVDYHQELEHNGIKFWCYNAGHVLGAAMWMIEIAGVKVLYTGDFSRQPDRHLLGAETPTMSPDVLIVESTYGIQVHEPRRQREVRFTKMVHEIVSRGGRCLIPVFALGRAQELLLILDEYWDSHPQLQKIPIYYASSLAQKCMSVFQTYINMMNERIRRQFDISNPFHFKHISNLKSVEEFEDTGPCVIMASPGMLQSGLSQELFEMWCSDPRNGVVIPGYCVEGTLAKKILSEPAEVTLSNGQTVPLKMTVRSISFSAHSDRAQTEEFIASTNPTYVVLVHGDPTNMTRLKQALQVKFPKIQVFTPKNCHTVEIMFQGEKIAKVVGTLANMPAKNGQEVSGVLLHKNFQHLLVSSKDLKTYSDIPCSGITQRLLVPLPSHDKWIKSLQNLFPCFIDEKTHFLNINVANAVRISIDLGKKTEAQLQWRTSSTNDLVADAVMNILLNDKNLFARSASEAALLYTVHMLLKERFKDTNLDLKTMTISMTVDGVKVSLNKNGKIKCDDKFVYRKVEMVMKRVYLALFPVHASLEDCICEVCQCKH